VYATINAVPANPSITRVSAATVCQTNVVFRVTSPASGASYSWLGSTGTASGTGNATYTVSSSTGIKSVSVYAYNAYCTSAANASTVTAYVGAIPDTPTLSVSVSSGKNTAATFTATGGSGTYEWNGAFSGQTGAIKYTPTSSGTYTTAVRSVINYNTINCSSSYTEAKTAVIISAMDLPPCNGNSSCPSGTSCWNGYCSAWGGWIEDGYYMTQQPMDVACRSGWVDVLGCPSSLPFSGWGWQYRWVATATSCTGGPLDPDCPPCRMYNEYVCLDPENDGTYTTEIRPYCYTYPSGYSQLHICYVQL
jgi:hypothetical protein